MSAHDDGASPSAAHDLNRGAGLTVDGGVYNGPPITDEQYAEICARHEAAGLPVPPRDAAFGAQDGRFVVAWSTPTAESHSAPDKRGGAS